MMDKNGRNTAQITVEYTQFSVRWILHDNFLPVVPILVDFMSRVREVT